MFLKFLLVLLLIVFYINNQFAAPRIGIDVPAIEFGKIGDKALLIETEFGEKASSVNGYFILIPTLEAYNKILHSFGM